MWEQVVQKLDAYVQRQPEAQQEQLDVEVGGLCSFVRGKSDDFFTGLDIGWSPARVLGWVRQEKVQGGLLASYCMLVVMACETAVCTLATRNLLHTGLHCQSLRHIHAIHHMLMRIVFCCMAMNQPLNNMSRHITGIITSDMQ